MPEEKKPLVTRNFLENLSRGLVKSIPLGGSLLEQVIYGTLDGEAAAKEAKKLHEALSHIADDLKGQEVGFADLLSKLEAQGEFQDSVRQELKKLGELVKNPGAELTTTIESAVESVLEGHGQKLEGLSGELDELTAMLKRLLPAIEASWSRQTPDQSPNEIPLIDLINRLALMHHSNLGSVIASFPGAGSVIRPQASPRDRANDLVEWATKQNPNEIPEVINVANRADPNFR